MQQKRLLFYRANPLRMSLVRFEYQLLESDKRNSHDYNQGATLSSI